MNERDKEILYLSKLLHKVETGRIKENRRHYANDITRLAFLLEEAVESEERALKKMADYPC